MHTILVLDDDTALLTLIRDALHIEGYHVVTKTTVAGVIESIQHGLQPDLFLLDIALPDQNGVTLCRELRNDPQFSSASIIFLTAKNDSEVVVGALEAGGDDYIRKPFAVKELLARLRAHLRRVEVNEMQHLPTLVFLPDRNGVELNGEVIPLTPVEYDLLHYLCHGESEWFTADELLSSVWNYPENVGDAALVRNHIRNLRLKLEHNPNQPRIVVSRHRRGYAVRAYIQTTEIAEN